MSEKLIFPIGFDLEEGVKKVESDWKKTYRKRIQSVVDENPIKIKLDFDANGVNLKDYKEYISLSKQAQKLQQEKLKTDREAERVAEQRAKKEKELARAENERARSAVIAEQQRAATARAENAELRLTRAKERSAQATHEQNAAYKTQSTYLSRLVQRMVAYASVAQAFSFIRNIRDVTAEFELQRVALGSIIGDLNEANAMFEQIKAAAVKSPFQIKELVTYTKQLAAYKIESDELFETTQRLADISAGLGVSMDRLVLAYGQIRATGHLRGSEVRQLTEAGIPIVEELSKKMSQLRGETVSAAEVMGMISERAISFGMVKEVFDDMTSAGGMFYKMQEKQAETLAGQWSNLQDAISIMYEEIGNTEGVNNAMKGMIGLIKSLAENWRDVWSVVQSLSVAMGVYYVAMKSAAVASTALTASEARLAALEMTREARMPRLIALMLGQNKAITVTIALNKALVFSQKKALMATTVLGKAFWKLTTAMLSNPYTAVLAALAGITVAIVKFATKTKTTQERIEDLNKSVASLTNLKNNVKPLVDELDALSQKSNKTVEEQKRLNQVTQELADKYPSTISAVREYGKEVDITAGKVRELYEAELKAKTVGLRAELAEDEKALAKLRAKYDAIRAKQIKGTKTIYVGDGEFDYTMEEVPLTTKELAELNKEARGLEEEMRPLEQSIHDAKVALGDIPPEATRAIEAFGSWKQTIKDFKTGLKNDLGEDINLFNNSDDIINQFTSLNDALDSVVEQYNKNDEAIKRYTQTLTSKKLTQAERKDIEDKKERATAFRDTASAILDYYNARSLLNKKKGGTEGESELSILQRELQLLEKIYAKYKEYRKYMSDEQAKAKVENYFGDTIKSLMFEPKYDSQGFKQVLKQYQDYARTLPESEKVVLDIGFKVEDIDWQDTKTELEDSLKRLSDELSRTKTAKEFFDRMLGMTGDKELSASLTVSIYGGEMGDDLGERLARDMASKFQEQVQTYFGDIDISSAINEATGEIDPIKLEKLLTEENIEKMGKDNVIEVRKIINDLIKANADYATELFKSYEKFFDYEKRMTMVTQREEEERKKIRESMIPDDQKAQLEEASKKREQEQISAIEIEQLKDTADWEKTFEDLNNLGSLTVKNLISLLEEYIAKKKEAGEPIAESDMKTLMNESNQLRERDAQLDPFETIKASLKDLTDATKEYNKAKKDGDEEGMADAQNKRAKALNKLETAVNAVASGFQNLSNLLTLLGIEDDSAMGEVFNGAAKALGIVATALSTAIALTLLWNSTLWANPLFAGVAIVSGVLGAIAGVFSAISNAKVRKANKEIERQQELIDSLGKSYEKLEKQIEKTFGSDYLDNYNDRLANLYAQQEAYLKQAEAERSKGKKEDEEKTQGYLDSASDVAEQIADMQKEVSERFLGTDLASTARDFAQSWIDAYKEFGSTTDAMKEKFHDMIQNMVVESIAGKMMQELLRPVFEDIEKYTKDGEFDENEIADIADMSIGLIDAMDEGMTGIVERLRAAGYDIRQSTSGLTGISKDIASASEESILGLASGINTQNFYISQVPPKLDTIIALLQGGGVQVGGGVNMQDLITIQNQHLAHLPNIAQNTADTVARCERAAVACERMADQLDRVIKPRGTQATHTVNTSL